MSCLQASSHRIPNCALLISFIEPPKAIYVSAKPFTNRSSGTIDADICNHYVISLPIAADQCQTWQSRFYFGGVGGVPILFCVSHKVTVLFRWATCWRNLLSYFFHKEKKRICCSIIVKELPLTFIKTSASSVSGMWKKLCPFHGRHRPLKSLVLLKWLCFNNYWTLIKLLSFVVFYLQFSSNNSLFFLVLLVLFSPPTWFKKKNQNTFSFWSILTFSFTSH